MPSSRAEIAAATAAVLVSVGRREHADGSAGDDARFVALADRVGLDTLAELWRDADPVSLPGALWALYLLRQWCHTNPDEVARLWRAGEAVAGADAVVAGVGDYADVVAVRRSIGMVFQKPNPFPTMSIVDNVTAGLRLTGASRSEMKERAQDALQSAGLWDEVKDRLNNAGGGLSGGQQQRLCIARALAVSPEVLLMDEPCSALDPKATLRIEELISQLREQVTIVIVTHNMQQAARVADTTCFMLNGEMVEVGQTEKMFTNPDDDRTEQYVTGKFG